MVVADDADSSVRATAMIAHAVAAFELARAREGLAALDSAATLLPTAEMRLQRLEWRLLLPFLGLPLADTVESARARVAIAVIARDGQSSPWRRRAQWALGTEAEWRGDSETAARWHAALAADADSNERYLETLLRALMLGRTDQEQALSLTDTLFMADPGAPEGDPFARAVFLRARARWQLAAGRLNDAEASLGWYENSDLRGWPQGPPQAGEVDQALSVAARIQRAGLLQQLRRTPEACDLLDRARELWSHADEQFAGTMVHLRTLREACP
jgi:hypothetical protein